MPRKAADVLAPIYDLSFIRLNELKDRSTHSGFPTPAFPDQAERTAQFNFKIHPVNRLDPSGDSLKKASVDWKVFLEPFDPEQGVIG
jgi:hypothetical protein